jgi:3-isopropylmalate/(R)-2-methylmalate dehydratase small subunit
MISGKVWKFGDDINTDAILPTAVMYLPASKQAKHVFSANRPDWAKDQVNKGDFLLAGQNFGTGSSRPAPLALSALGIKCLIADSINPLFLRNCVSFGLPAIECAGASDAFEEGDSAEVSFETGTIKNTRTGALLNGLEIPTTLLKLMQNGGIFPLLESEGLISPIGEAATDIVG